MLQVPGAEPEREETEGEPVVAERVEGVDVAVGGREAGKEPFLLGDVGRLAQHLEAQHPGVVLGCKVPV